MPGRRWSEPTWAVPVDSWADWLPDWLCPASYVVDELEPVCWPLLVELQEARTQTGALAFTGADTSAAGSTVAEPTWAVSVDSSADWSAGSLLEPEPEPPFGTG